MAFVKKQETKETAGKGKLTRYGIYPINITVFDNEEKGVNVKIARTYRDKDGNWQETSNFNLQDLPVIAKLLEDVIKDSIVHTEKAY